MQGCRYERNSSECGHQFSQKHLLKVLSFLYLGMSLPLPVSDGCSYKYSCLLVLLFCPIGSCPLCASTILFILLSLRLCNISWDLQSPIVFVFFAQGSFGYLELFLVPYEFKIFFLFLWRMLWKFWFGLYWIYKLILVAWSFSQYLILLIYEQYIFLNLFLQRFSL